jgi:hypothetical protein
MSVLSLEEDACDVDGRGLTTASAEVNDDMMDGMDVSVLSSRDATHRSPPSPQGVAAEVALGAAPDL